MRRTAARKLAGKRRSSKSSRRFDIRFAARAVPKEQHKNRLRVRKDFVNDPAGSVDDFADSRFPDFRHHTAHFWKCGGGQCAVNQFVAQMCGRVRGYLWR